MNKVEVKSLRIHAKHGCHEEERKSGGMFEVDICVYGEFFFAAKTDDIKDAVDYVGLMEVASEVMSIPKNLIETVAETIAQEVMRRFSSVLKVDVTIRKMKPPVKHDVDFVSCFTSLERAQN